MDSRQIHLEKDAAGGPMVVGYIVMAGSEQLPVKIVEPSIPLGSTYSRAIVEPPALVNAERRHCSLMNSVEALEEAAGSWTVDVHSPMAMIGRFHNQPPALELAQPRQVEKDFSKY
jgi:hypothetical protein